MTGIVPDLDDVAFDELVEEARGLIPEFAPDWTDHNLHDPGITIIDLLAFLTDQQVYRIGYVGPSLRRAFTRLLGIVPEPARGARFEVWPFAGAVGAETILADGTDIRSDEIPDGRFMTEGAVRLVPRRVTGLKLVEPGRESELGGGLLEGRTPLRLAPSLGGGPIALDLHLDAAPGAGTAPLTLGVLVDAAPMGADWDPVVVEEATGSGLWAPLPVEDGTHGLTRTGTIRFWPETGKLIRLRLDVGQRPGSVTLGRIGLNVIAVREGWRDIEEAVTEGTGLPDHAVDFPLADIDADSHLELQSDGPGGPVTWQTVETFQRSGPGDAHVIADAEAGRLVFGNGVNGRSLGEGETVRHLPLTRTSGAAGNIAKGAHWRLLGAAWGENLSPGRDGRDADTLATLIARARAVAAARTGVLDADTLAARADAAGLGLSRLEILPGRRPGRAAGGSRTVLAVPDRSADAPPGPPRSDVIERLGEALAPSRLLGERLYVATPIYLHVDVDVAFAVRPDAERESLRAMIADRIKARLWDIPRRDDVVPWTPGRPVSTGDIRALVADLEDVRRMAACTLRPADNREAPGGLLPLGDREFPMARDVRVSFVAEASP